MVIVMENEIEKVGYLRPGLVRDKGVLLAYGIAEDIRDVLSGKLDK